MTLKQYLWIMSITTFLCWGAWTYILFIVDPETTNWIGLALFYGSLFPAVVGTTAILGFVIRFVALKQKLAFHSVSEAFRQSFLFAGLVIVSLLLLAHNLFTWLNLGLLVLGLSILEYLLISRERGA